MLRQLNIRDLVIVQELHLDFGVGMSVLTGETGAGKSILIDALGLALGNKADPRLIRAGADKAEVSALFDLGTRPTVQAWLEERDLADDAECIVRRVLVREGRARAYINGSPATMALVQELGQQLVDVHGQHAHQSLLKSASQRQLLDAFAGAGDIAAEVSRNHRDHKQLLRQINELETGARDNAERADFLRYQLEELEPAVPRDHELEQLDRDQRRLANADTIAATCADALAHVENDEGGVLALINRASGPLAELVQADPGLGEIMELLEGARIQCDEAASALRRQLDRIERDPEQLARIDQRLAQLHDLARKHRVEPAALPDRAAELGEELDQIGNTEARVENLNQQAERLLEAYRASAKALSQKRLAAARTLADEVNGSLRELAMSGATFAVDLAALNADEPHAHGQEQVQFLVSTNPGQPPDELSRIASGGELSRISLAIQLATAEVAQVPTLIFDEVDVGIGGGVAEVVGRMLRRLGRDRQVLSVTHLAQVAAQGHAHYQVSKIQDQHAARTQIARLADEQRVEELARMSGGLEISEQTLAHGRELLERVETD